MSLLDIADPMPTTLRSLYRCLNMDLELKQFCPDRARADPLNFIAWAIFLLMVFKLFLSGCCSSAAPRKVTSPSNDSDSGTVTGSFTGDGESETRSDFTQTHRDEATQTDSERNDELMPYLDNRFGSLERRLQHLVECCCYGHKLKGKRECGTVDTGAAMESGRNAQLKRQLQECEQHGAELEQQLEMTGRPATYVTHATQTDFVMDGVAVGSTCDESTQEEGSARDAQAQIAKLKDRLVTSEFEASYAKSRLEEAREEAKAAKKKIEEVEKPVKDAEARQKDAEGRQAELQSQVEQVETEHKNVKSQLQRESAARVDAQERAEALEKEVSYLKKKQLEHAKSTAAESKVAKLQEQINVATKQKADLGAEFVSKVEALERERDQAAKKQQDAERQLKTELDNATKKQREIEKQASDHHASTEKLKEAQRQNADLQKQLDNAKKHVCVDDEAAKNFHTANLLIEEATRLQIEAEAQRDNAANAAKSANERAQLLEQNLEVLQQEKMDLERQRQEALDANISAAQRYDAMQNDLSTTSQRLSVAETQFNLARGREQQLQADIERLRTEATAKVEELRAKLSDSLSTYQALTTLNDQYLWKEAELQRKLDDSENARRQYEVEARQSSSMTKQRMEIGEDLSVHSGNDWEMDAEQQEPGVSSYDTSNHHHDPPASEPQQEAYAASNSLSALQQQPLKALVMENRQMGASGFQQQDGIQQQDFTADGSRPYQDYDFNGQSYGSSSYCLGCDLGPASLDGYGPNCPPCDTPGCTGRQVMGDRCMSCCWTHKVPLNINGICSLCDIPTKCINCLRDAELDEESRCAYCRKCPRCNRYKGDGECNGCCKMHRCALDDEGECILCDIGSEDDDDDLEIEQCPGQECPDCPDGQKRPVTRNGVCDRCQKCPVLGCGLPIPDGVCHFKCEKEEHGHLNVNTGKCDECKAASTAETCRKCGRVPVVKEGVCTGCQDCPKCNEPMENGGCLYCESDDESDADEDERGPRSPPQIPGITLPSYPIYQTGSTGAYSQSPASGKPFRPIIPPKEPSKRTTQEIEQEMQERKALGLCPRCGEKLVNGDCVTRPCGLCFICGERTNDMGVCVREGCGRPTGEERANIQAGLSEQERALYQETKKHKSAASLFGSAEREEERMGHEEEIAVRISRPNIRPISQGRLEKTRKRQEEQKRQEQRQTDELENGNFGFRGPSERNFYQVPEKQELKPGEVVLSLGASKGENLLDKTEN